ncbi:MAG: hypothetical protein ACHQJD_03340 [Thermoanaerobaculia bacterium]
MSGDERTVSRGAKALAVLLTLLPPARMARIVFTYGENNLSNDYVARVPVVAAILDGRYPFARLFRDTWIWGGHSWLALLPFYWLDARFFAWDLNVELGIGLALTALKTLLVWLAVSGPLTRAARWALLPALSFLAFSVSQVTSFTFGESVLQMQLVQVAVAAGALALARFTDRPGLRGASLAACGLLASWSWGGGVMAWPVFAVALFASGERSFRRWVLLTAAAALGLAQYVWFLVIAPLPSVVKSPGLRGLWRVVDLVGRPFANGTGRNGEPLPAAIVFGAAGLFLVAVAVWAARHALRERIPALVILGWSLLLALQISIFRSDVAPWYIMPMTVFWLGLAALLAGAPRPIAIAGFATIAVGLLYSNRTWEDKSFYLPSRAPVSAACLREWRTAPPLCHDLVFQWGKSYPGDFEILAGSLERAGLSVFGPRRTYLLQGDVAVGRVVLEISNERTFFSRDDRTPADPNDFHRLDLVLAPGTTVSWRIDLPPGTRRAAFSTVVRAAPGDPHLGRGARVSVTAEGSSVVLEERVFLPRETARPLSVDLSALAGKRITLHLAAEETQTGAMPLVFEAPQVLMTLDPEQNHHAS